MYNLQSNYVEVSWKVQMEFTRFGWLKQWLSTGGYMLFSGRLGLGHRSKSKEQIVTSRCTINNCHYVCIQHLNLKITPPPPPPPPTTTTPITNCWGYLIIIFHFCWCHAPLLKGIRSWQQPINMFWFRLAVLIICIRWILDVWISIHYTDT